MHAEKFGAAMAIVKSDIGGNITVRYFLLVKLTYPIQSRVPHQPSRFIISLMA